MPIIPEFAMYEDGLEQSELSDIANRLAAGIRTGKDRFMHFTDILTEYVGSGEWKNRSEGFLALCAKASFLRGLYGYNQVLAKSSTSIVCKGYAAAAYCRQSLDPRWMNNLQTYVNQAWQAMREDGLSCKQIAAKVGCGQSTVPRYTVAPKNKIVGYTPAYRALAVEYFLEHGQANTRRSEKYGHLATATLHKWKKALHDEPVFNPDNAKLPQSVMFFAGINGLANA